MKASHKRRLLKCADIVERAKDFDMNAYFHECGSPSCVLGHYAKATKFRVFGRPEKGCEGWFPDWTKIIAKEHFGLDMCEVDELFSQNGCNHARTGKQAAEYIRRFVKRKLQEAMPCRIGQDTRRGNNDG